MANKLFLKLISIYKPIMSKIFQVFVEASPRMSEQVLIALLAEIVLASTNENLKPENMF